MIEITTSQTVTCHMIEQMNVQIKSKQKEVCDFLKKIRNSNFENRPLRAKLANNPA